MVTRVAHITYTMICAKSMYISLPEFVTFADADLAAKWSFATVSCSVPIQRD